MPRQQRGRFRNFIATVAVATLGVVGGASLVTSVVKDSGGAVSGTANLWVDANGGSCTRSSTAASYVDATACSSLGAAYAAATSGDTIGVTSAQGGTLPGETLSGRSKTLTYTVPDGETINFSSKVDLANLSNVTFNGPFVARTNDSSLDLRIFCSQNLELHDFSGRVFYITDGSREISLYGGEWGGYDASDGPSFGDSAISGYDGGVDCTGLAPGDGWVRNILLDGVYIHDVYYGPESTWNGAHPDCLETYGMTDGVTIRNSVFERCGYTFIGWYTDFADNFNLLVENNLMLSVADAFTYIQITDGGGGIGTGPFECSAIFRYNTIDTSVDASPTDTEPILNCDTMAVYGNVFTQGPNSTNCEVASYWSYNVFENDAGGCDGNHTKVGAMGWVDRITSDTDSNYDYHLSVGSLASGAGDPSNFPSTDFEDDSRPADTNPDAGYDERDD